MPTRSRKPPHRPNPERPPNAHPTRAPRKPSSPRRGAASGATPKAFASPRLRLAARDRRTQILAAALEIFSERGFHGTRTRELADRAGVSEALVFSHFPTKEALIRAIIDRVGLRERVRVLEDRLTHMPPREALIALAEDVLTN